MAKAFISGCAGEALTESEVSFLAEQRPWGLILFRRNCAHPDQVRDLIAHFRESVEDPGAPVLIDQEGGRVQRLRPPHWPSFPPQKRFGDLYQADPQRAREAAYLAARLLGDELSELGITVNCLPLLDVLTEATSDAIGDRAYGSDPAAIADLGRETCEGLLAAGVLPVLKHVPGHGRATVDSHLELPVVDAALEELEACDFAPFKTLSGYPLAMTAHIRFPALGESGPATQSRHVIDTVVRSRIGFQGCLLSDDISMKALGGDMRERAAAAFGAGCDIVLHCNGDLAEMQAVAASAPELSGMTDRRCRDAMLRLRTAQKACRSKEPFDREAAWSRFRVLLGD